MRGLGITALGLVASGKRNILPGYEFDSLYSRRGLVGTDPIVGGEWSDTYDTLNKMAEIVKNTLSDTKKVAARLQGNTLAQTVENIWNHVYSHFQYSKDRENMEQIRRPARSWVDRRAGIDCDCMSVVISSLLHHLNIEHAFRKAAYKPEIGWQHVYVIVPKRKGLSLDKRDNYYVLDCVVDRFNYEVPFIDHYDKLMKIQYLNGVDFSTLTGGVTSTLSEQASNGLLGGLGSEFSGLDALSGIDAAPDELAVLFMKMLKQHLVNTRKILALNPSLTAGLYDPATFAQRLDYLIASFDNAKTRNKALGELAALEDREEVNGLSGHGLGKGFFKKVGQGLKKVGKLALKTVTEPAKLAIKAHKKIAQNAGKIVKTAAKFVVRFNPATIAIRNGVLLAMKLNLFRLAEKLGYGYWTEAQVKEKALDLNEFRSAKKTLAKVRNIFKGLGGKVDKFDNAVREGWRHGVKKHHLVSGLNGLDGRKYAKSDGKQQKATSRKLSRGQVKRINTHIKSAMPLLQLVNAQLSPIEYKTLLRKPQTQELDAFYQAIRTNKDGVATKLSLAYKPAQEAVKYDKTEYAKLLQRARATENLVGKRGGTLRELREAIEAGKQVAIPAQQLGVVVAASTAAASSVLGVIAKLLKSINFSKLFKGRASSPNASTNEIQKADVSAPLDKTIDDEGDPNAKVLPLQKIVESVTSPNDAVQPDTSEDAPTNTNDESTSVPAVAVSTPDDQTGNDASPDAYDNTIEVTTPTGATPGIVVSYAKPKKRTRPNATYQNAQVVATKINTPDNNGTSNTVKYIAIAGGVGIALWLLTKGTQRGTNVQPTPTVPQQQIQQQQQQLQTPLQPQLSGVKKSKATSKKMSQRTPKVMTITV